MNKNKKIIFKMLMIILALLGYYFLNHKFDFNIPCIFYKITGLFSPRCGITRMLFSLIELKIYQAFRYNPLIFCLLIMDLLYNLIYRIYNYKLKINSKFYYVILVIVTGFGILRNFPIFNFLKPISI